MSYLPARAGQLSRFATLCLGWPYFAGETPIRRKAALNWSGSARDLPHCPVDEQSRARRKL